MTIRASDRAPGADRKPGRAPIVLAGALVLALAAAGCGGDDAVPEDAPEADVMLDAAGEAIQSMESVRFEIEIDGAPVFLDSAKLLAASGAVGRYSAPVSFDVLVDVKVSDLVVQIGAVSIGTQRWATNPLTGTWEAFPPGFGFDPLLLFDPGTGLGPLLSEGMTDAEVQGVERRGDGSRYHVTGLLDGDRVEVITAGLVRDEAIGLDVWLEPETFRLTEAAFATTNVDGDPSNWRIRFSEFDAEVVIDPPAQ